MDYIINIKGSRYTSYDTEQAYLIEEEDITIEDLIKGIPIEEFVSFQIINPETLVDNKRIVVSIEDKIKGYRDLPYNTVIKDEVPNGSTLNIGIIYACG